MVDNIPRRIFQAEVKAHGMVTRHEIAWPIRVSSEYKKKKKPSFVALILNFIL